MQVPLDQRCCQGLLPFRATQSESRRPWKCIKSIPRGLRYVHQSQSHMKNPQRTPDGPYWTIPKGEIHPKIKLACVIYNACKQVVLFSLDKPGIDQSPLKYRLLRVILLQEYIFITATVTMKKQHSILFSNHSVFYMNLSLKCFSFTHIFRLNCQ